MLTKEKSHYCDKFKLLGDVFILCMQLCILKCFHYSPSCLTNVKIRVVLCSILVIFINQSKGACIEQLSGRVRDLRKSFVEICMCP